MSTLTAAHGAGGQGGAGVEFLTTYHPPAGLVGSLSEADNANGGGG